MTQEKLHRAARAAGFAMVEFEDTLRTPSTRHDPEQPSHQAAERQSETLARSWAGQDWLGYFTRKATPAG
ncbi:MAG: hypothetical protein KDJ36_07175 [Hyphomicrobiaceae bacterium]|nr:hypothetical protein [Hyphomicrobiaceae bacterium]